MTSKFGLKHLGPVVPHCDKEKGPRRNRLGEKELLTVLFACTKFGTFLMHQEARSLSS